MARRTSRMLALGTIAPDFSLPDAVSGRTVALAGLREAPALLVAFICNHCPYVKHLADGLPGFGRDIAPRGLAKVAVRSKDVTAYPDDAPDAMGRFAREKGFVFPYLYDESQAIALAYEAICTPTQTRCCAASARAGCRCRAWAAASSECTLICCS